jgi:hypothetical protein
VSYFPKKTNDSLSVVFDIKKFIFFIAILQKQFADRNFLGLESPDRASLDGHVAKTRVNKKYILASVELNFCKMSIGAFEVNVYPKISFSVLDFNGSFSVSIGHSLVNKSFPGIRETDNCAIQRLQGAYVKNFKIQYGGIGFGLEVFARHIHDFYGRLYGIEINESKNYRIVLISIISSAVVIGGSLANVVILKGAVAGECVVKTFHFIVIVVGSIQFHLLRNNADWKHHHQ